MTDPTPVLDLIEAFRRSKTMFAGCELGIFDLLESGPQTASALASSAGADPDSLRRLLDALASLGFLARDGDTYSNTPVAYGYLRRASPNTLTGYILYSNEVLWRLWANLEDATREGTHRWKQTFGFDGPIFNHFFRTDDAMRTFMRGMNGLGLLSSPSVAAAFDLSSFRRAVDLGGGTGHLAVALARRWPDLRATVFDLPQVIEFAKEYTEGRVTLCAGDFFTDPLPEADLFALGRILHDWSEEKIGRILHRIFDRLPSGGAVLIAEKLLDSDKRGPVPAHMQSLNMLLCTEGRERTREEYRALLEDAGFTEVEAKETGTPLDAILGRKR